MTTYQWGQWAQTAAAASGGPTLPEGEGYVGEIIDAGAKDTKKGQPRLWWKFKVLVGPSAGETEVLGQVLNPENPKALAAFYGVLGRLGIDFSRVPDGTPPEAVAKLVIGNRYSFDFSHRADGDRKFANFTNVKQLEGSAPAAAPAPVAVPAAPAPAPAPVAEAPTSPAQQTVEELQAQLAALQAAQAPAAPAAPAITVTAPAEGAKLPF